MKQLYFSYLFPPFLFFFLTLFHSENSYAQSGWADTNYVKSFADSCKGLNTSEEKISCGNEILKLIQLDWEATKNQKEKICLAKTEVNVLRNIGNAYRELSMSSKALEYYQKSMSKAEKQNLKKGIAAALLNIGNVYLDLSDYKKSLDYFQKGLKHFEEIEDAKGIGMCLNGIGGSYSNLSEPDKALEYYKKGLKIQEELQDTIEVATCLGNIADTYKKIGDFPNAMAYYRKALNISEKINDVEDVIKSLFGIGEILMETDKSKEAEQYFLKVLILSKEVNSLDYEALAYQFLRNVYQKQGNYKEALMMNDSFTVVFDSITILNAKSEITKMEMRSDFDKKEAETKAEHDKQIAVEEEKNQKQRVVIFSVIAGLLLVVVFSIFVLNRWRVTQRQKKIIEVQKAEVDKQRELADSRRIIAEEQKYVIEIQKTEVEKQKEIVDEQKKLVEEKNKDITDSINYARRIQRAMLPHRSDIWKAFPQSFVLYKPKDIVSGDFYFFAPALKGEIQPRVLGANSPLGVGGGCFFIAACDCTGHGVPGAFMSMIGSAKLNDAVAESSDTSEILSLLNKGVKTSLKQSDSEDSTRDGMDIAFCSVDTENRIVKYAGANRPIWIIRKDQTAVEEIKATKKAIGGFTEDSQRFDTHEIRLQEGDTFYLSTDGYGDTYGKEGKKIMTKKFKEILLSIQDKPMKEQEKHLDDFVENWKSGTEQVDDILVIGIRM